jgi:hypothetical protein
MGLVPNAGPGVNPIYSPTGSFNGYFSYMNATGYASNTGTIANFNLPLTGLSSIPAGSWNFSNQIYTFTVPAGTYPNPNNQTPSSISIYPSITYWHGGTGTKIASTTKPVAVGYTDAPYIYSLFTQTSTPILNPATDYLNFNFAATGAFASNQYIEFWTNGDSIANVITPFAPQSGPTGSVGPTGAAGTNGLQGVTGPAGTNGDGLTGTPGQIAFYGPSGTATGTSNLIYDGTSIVVSNTAVGSSFLNASILSIDNGNSVFTANGSGGLGLTSTLGGTPPANLTMTGKLTATQIDALVSPSSSINLRVMGGAIPSPAIFFNSGSVTAELFWNGLELQLSNPAGVADLTLDNGGVYAANFTVTSDKNIKENIVDARNTYLEDLLKLRVVNYNLIKDEKKTKQLGFIAQEVEEVFPSVVQHNGSGIKGISQTALIPMLVSAIQSLKKELDDLKRSLVR